jgi:hypothetical protein
MRLRLKILRLLKEVQVTEFTYIKVFSRDNSGQSLLEKGETVSIVTSEEATPVPPQKTTTSKSADARARCTRSSIMANLEYRRKTLLFATPAIARDKTAAEPISSKLKPDAVRLCFEKLILPEAAHIVKHARE